MRALALNIWIQWGLTNALIEAAAGSFWGGGRFTPLIKHAQKLPHELYKSLTWDRGKEMADHQRFTLATDIKVYFCDPQSPWQRGSNENANGILRQYLPKGIDLSAYSQSKLNAIARHSTNARGRH